jgi:1-deoxy-D-xylulose-5-phosphate reductoisomerase
LEVIEAKWLFGVKAQQVEVVVHPQSIIHSLIEFEDGSIKAQMGLPDMRLPIQYALAYPERIHSNFPRFSFWDYPQLTFEKPDIDTFQCLDLAYQSLENEGNSACILNAANEVAVQLFLDEQIGFLDIPDIIAESMAKIPFISKPDLEDYIQTDQETRRFASVNKNNKFINVGVGIK